MKILLTLLFLVVGCSTSEKIYTRQPLFEQRLAPRPNYIGLTNQVCAEKKDGKCLKMHVLEYDLRDKKTRDQLRALKFICKVGSERYRIHPNSAYLVNSKCRKSWFKTKCDYKFISFVHQYQILINANIDLKISFATYLKSIKVC